jgi:hypothetical protein
MQAEEASPGAVASWRGHGKLASHQQFPTASHQQRQGWTCPAWPVSAQVHARLSCSLLPWIVLNVKNKTPSKFCLLLDKAVSQLLGLLVLPMEWHRLSSFPPPHNRPLNIVHNWTATVRTLHVSAILWHNSFTPATMPSRYSEGWVDGLASEWVRMWYPSSWWP